MKADRCDDPLHADVLADYWVGELPASEESEIEEHLLGCGECSSALQEIVTLADGIRELAREGALRMVISPEFLARLVRDGFRVRQYAPPAGGKVACTVTASDDLLVARLAADLSRCGRVDLVMCGPSGVERARLRDVPVNAAAREVILHEPIGPVRRSGPDVLLMKLVSVQEGRETVLAEYTFDHTPSPQQPGG